MEDQNRNDTLFYFSNRKTKINFTIQPKHLTKTKTCRPAAVSSSWSTGCCTRCWCFPRTRCSRPFRPWPRSPRGPRTQDTCPGRCSRTSSQQCTPLRPCFIVILFRTSFTIPEKKKLKDKKQKERHRNLPNYSILQNFCIGNCF